MASTSLSPGFPDLRRSPFLSLTTYRTSGTPVSTPVLWAPLGDTVVLMTDERSHKVRRLRRDDRVEVAPCGPRGGVTGPAMPGRGRLLDDGEAAAALAALVDRFPVRLRVFRAAARAPWAFVEVSRA